MNKLPKQGSMGNFLCERVSWVFLRGPATRVLGFSRHRNMTQHRRAAE